LEESFTLINIGVNVSAGIVLGGRLHHGAQWSAGEIAYLRVPTITHRLPRLHEFGELESVLTTSAILQEWNASLVDQHSKEAPAQEESDVVKILDRAQTGDPKAAEIIKTRAAIVSDIIMNLALILNPGLILLGGEIGSHPILLTSVQEELVLSEFAVTRIAAATLGELAVRWGAIAVALEKIPLVLLPQPRD